MPHPAPRLITELLALASTWGWSVSDFASELRVDATTILHYRSGRRGLTVRTLARIASRFGEHRMVRDLVWHYLVVECADEAAVPTGAVVAPEGLAPALERALRAYADHFAEESVHAGRGLYVVSETASQLSVATRFLQEVVAAMKIRVCVLHANRRPAATESRSALAAPLLIVERMDFACEAVRDLVRQRANLTRPTVLTSMREPGDESDAHLRRVFVSTMRCIRGDVPVPTTPAPTDPSRLTHAA